jgi:hypothetical protein
VIINNPKYDWLCGRNHYTPAQTRSTQDTRQREAAGNTDSARLTGRNSTDWKRTRCGPNLLFAGWQRKGVRPAAGTTNSAHLIHLFRGEARKILQMPLQLQRLNTLGGDEIPSWDRHCPQIRLWTANRTVPRDSFPAGYKWHVTTCQIQTLRQTLKTAIQRRMKEGGIHSVEEQTFSPLSLLGNSVPAFKTHSIS